MSSRSCENIFAFVTHCMLRSDNFSTRKSGNTLGRFLMSLNNVEEQTVLSIIKVMQKCWQKSIKVSLVPVWQINRTLYHGLYNLMEPFITFRLWAGLDSVFTSYISPAQRYIERVKITIIFELPWTVNFFPLCSTPQKFKFGQTVAFFKRTNYSFDSSAWMVQVLQFSGAVKL